MDYLPNDLAPSNLTERAVKISGRNVKVFSDLQMDHNNHFCRHLDAKSGRCKQYTRRPFACDFELIRFLHYKEKVVIMQKLFGRGWAMKRIDGEQGAKCEMLDTDPYWLAEVQRKLDGLTQWANHFGLRTRIALISSWVTSGPHARPLLISAEELEVR
ncbi:MAG: hypothetical protein ISR51_02700 [Rhodospirillales bacterium]|nr:hypothetical protein [Rhodospirillales bacterium]